MQRLIIIISLFLLGASLSLHAQSEKISPALKEEMSKQGANELIPIIICLSQQPDIKSLEIITEGMIKSNRREYVINNLKNLSMTTQANLRSYLRSRENENKARMISPIFLANIIAVKLQNKLISDITNMSEVNYIFLDQKTSDLAVDTTENVKKIRAPEVWSNFGYTGEGVLVAVMDTGIDYDHSDLHSNIWNNLGEDDDEDGHTLELVSGEWSLDPGDINGIDDDGNGKIDDFIGWDWNDGIHDEDNNPMDDQGHGTHVAGTIAGDGTGDTLTGVASDAKLMILKIWELIYGESEGTSSNYCKAVQYALENGADVVNLSGGKTYSSLYMDYKETCAIFRQVFESAITAGMTIVVCAGNEFGTGRNFVPHNVCTPGNVPMVITVGNTSLSDQIASSSSRGPVEWDNYCKGYDEWGENVCYSDFPYPPGLLKPDVCAPGLFVTSTKMGGGYTEMSGTSMATPAVSGTVALLLEAQPNLKPNEMKYILEKTAIDCGPAGKDSIYGSGRIDAEEAVEYTLQNYGKMIRGELTFDDDFIIEQGDTVIITPGTVLKFYPGKRLYVYGTLIAEGAQDNYITFTSAQGTPEPGDWYGIWFEDSSVDNDCIVKYCKIKYTTDWAIRCYKASPKIENNIISDYYFDGIYVYQGNPSIKTNEIRSSEDGNGIYLYDADPDINDNYIYNAYGAGIYIRNYSYPHLFNNTIKGCWEGVNVRYHSIPQFGSLYDATGGYNVIKNNYYGISAVDHAYPFLGSTDAETSNRLGGMNSIFNNTYKNAKSTYYSDIEAEHNWWGASPPPSKFYSDGTSSIDYTPYLNSNPGGGSSLGKMLRTPEIEVQEPITSGDGIPRIEWLWIRTKHFLATGRYAKAQHEYKKIIREFPGTSDSKEALVKLYTLSKEIGDQDLSYYLIGFINNTETDSEFKCIAMDILCSLYIKENKLSQAIDLCQVIIQQYPGTESEKSALYSLFNVYCYDLKDKVQTNSTLAAMKQKYPNHELTLMARIRMGEKVDPGLLRAARMARREAEEQEETTETTVIPETYNLDQNYPNPFNPVTTIRYQLPVECNVYLKVYDITGRIAETLVEKKQSAGVYNVSFDGSGLASGVYFYRIEAGEFIEIQKMILMK